MDSMGVLDGTHQGLESYAVGTFKVVVRGQGNRVGSGVGPTISAKFLFSIVTCVFGFSCDVFFLASSWTLFRFEQDICTIAITRTLSYILHTLF